MERGYPSHVTWGTSGAVEKKKERSRELPLRPGLRDSFFSHIPALLPAAFTSPQEAFCRIFLQSQLRWAGHIARLSYHRLPKRLFYGELQRGVRSRGGQKRRFKGTLKTSLKAFRINTDALEQPAVDRARWRYSIRKCASLCEERRTAAAQRKRQAREARCSSKQEQVSHVPCPSCHRTFRARIGLISHMRIHKSSHRPSTSR